MSKLNQITQAEVESLEREYMEALHAGFPSPAADHAGERLDLFRELNHHPATTFYARVEGDSMRDAGILDGDIVVIDRSLEPQNGDYIVAFVNGEYTLKEFRFDTEEGCAWLIPHNEAYRPIRVTSNENFIVWGVVTHSVHKMK